MLATSTALARRGVRDRNVRLCRGGVVHAVEMRDWYGIELPVPACHVGVSGWDFARMEPVRTGVTCKRCVRTAAGRAAPPFPTVGGQLALVDLDELS